MFIDEAKIFVRSGNGGNGMVHFHREKFVTRGGPDGGDGGRGGDVVIQVVPTLNTLQTFSHKKRFIADDGGNGGCQQPDRQIRRDLVISVPPGTIVYDETTGELVVRPGGTRSAAGFGQGWPRWTRQHPLCQLPATRRRAPLKKANPARSAGCAWSSS